MTAYKSILTRVEEGPDGLHLRTLTDDEQLRASLRVLLDWCITFLNDDKHLIGSVCREADDAQFRYAIEQARIAIKGAIPTSSVCTTCGELIPQGCCTCGPRQRLA